MRATTEDPADFTIATELNLLFGHTQMRHFRLSPAESLSVLPHQRRRRPHRGLPKVRGHSGGIAACADGGLECWALPALTSRRKFHRAAAAAASHVACPLWFLVVGNGHCVIPSSLDPPVLS